MKKIIVDTENATCIANPFKPGENMVAAWTYESYTYAIDTDGISANIILNLIQQME